MNKFKAEPAARETRPGVRSGFSRWKNSRPFAGNWYALELPEEDVDVIEEDDLVRDRIRQLFLRYGVLFREMLTNEMPSLQWGRIFKTLRRMELSGEVFTGYFFRGVPGVQFCSHAALRELNRPLPDDAVYWMNACDPASLCGSGIEAFKGSLPARIPGNHIVYRGDTVVLISKRNGGDLTIFTPSEDPGIADCLSLFPILLSRQFQPLSLIETETINGVPALDSPYCRAMLDFGFARDYRSLVLRRRY